MILLKQLISRTYCPEICPNQVVAFSSQLIVLLPFVVFVHREQRSERGRRDHTTKYSRDQRTVGNVSIALSATIECDDGCTEQPAL